MSNDATTDITDDALDRVPCGFLRFTDGGGEILKANTMLLAMLGYRAKELEGLRVDAVLSSAARLFCQTHFFPLLTLRGEVEEIYFSLLDKQGESVPVLVNAVRRETNGDAWIDCILVRMKQRGHYEDALLQATREAERTAELREREHFLQSVINVMPGVLQVFDLEKQSSVFINRNIGLVLGYSPEEITAMGDNVTATLLHPDDVVRLPAHLDRVRALHDNEIADFEYRLRDRAGTWHWFHSRDAIFARDAAGAVCQFIGTAIEITARKQAEEQLQESEERFHATFASAPVGIAHIGLDGRWLRFNDAICMITGYDSEKLAMLTFTDITHPDDLEAD